MAAIPLSDDENVAIFTQPAFSALSGLEQEQREQFLKRVLELLESPTPKHFIEKEFSNCDELQQLRAGDILRGLCRLLMGVHGYNILFVFYVTKHKYRQLALYDQQACEVVERVTNIEYIEDIESYLSERDAMTAEDIEDIIENPP